MHIPAFEFLVTWEATSRFIKPTGLVLEHLLATDAPFLDQKRTFRACQIVRVTVVSYLNTMYQYMLRVLWGRADN